jgi:hypothetical protein
MRTEILLLKRKTWVDEMRLLRVKKKSQKSNWAKSTPKHSHKRPHRTYRLFSHTYNQNKPITTKATVIIVRSLLFISNTL